MNKIIIGLIFAFGGAMYFAPLYVIPLCLVIVFLAFLIVIDRIKPSSPFNELRLQQENLDNKVKEELSEMEEKIRKLHNRININSTK